MNKLLLFLATLLYVGCSSTPRPTAEEVMEITCRVADWQIETFEDQVQYRALSKSGWKGKSRHHDLKWTSAAFYSGLAELARIDYNKKYTDFLKDVGNRNGWRPYDRVHHADDHAVGHFYLDLNDRYSSNKMIVKMRKQFDTIMTDEKRDDLHWWWCDALYMAPPVWVRMAKATGQDKYLEYMDYQYRKTYDLLWDDEEDLFFRDKKYLDKKEENGEKLFWARGNGWVFGGLALMIPDMPADWKSRDFYVTMFKEMAAKLITIQREDGTWSTGLLGDESAYPTIETSGTAFFAYGLAWGMNYGLLDRKTYEEPMLRAWNALCGAVTEEGMLSYVQGIGAAPGESYPDKTELYGSGAFITAGAEIYNYIKNFYPVPDKIKPSEASYTFMHSGGWCWYQDPRVIMNNGKLVVGGLDGVSGDVRVSVFDLKSKKIDGELVLHEGLQRDDHDAPAFYLRPDGSILSMWARHGNDKIHRYKISSPDNYLEWSDLNEFHHVYSNPHGVTYMNLLYMKDEALLYNFFRDGPTFNPAYMTSKDHGQTWGTETTHFIANDIKGRHRPYTRYNQIDENTVGVSYTDGHPRDYGNSLYYVEFRDGNFYKVDGTLIHSIEKGPLHTSEGEKLYKGSEVYTKPKGCESVPNSAWSCATSKDAEGNPHLGYTLYLTNDDHRFRITSWDGEKWNDREIAYAGTCLYTRESSYTGLMAFDPTDPTMVYISTDVNPSTGEYTGGVHEIYGAKVGVTDDINTIEWKAYTKDSKYRNIRPIVVTDGEYKVLTWLHGKWDTFTNYDVNVVGEFIE